MTRPYRLHYAPDNASLVVRMVLEELQQPYETALVERRLEEQRSPAYLRVNPNGLIPAIETPHGIIFETGAILLWLADTHRQLAPTMDSPDRGEFLKWLFYVSNTLHPALQRMFYPGKYVPRQDQAMETLQDRCKSSIRAHLSIINDHYKPANTPTVTDFYLAACLRWVQIYGHKDKSWMSLETYPVLHGLVTALERRASVRAAIQAEGLGARPFTAPQYPQPPEGSAV